MGLLVFQDIDVVAAATHHALFLFAEGAEQVFHQSPVEEGAILVGPCALHPRELAHLGNGVLGGGYNALVLVEVEENLQLVADVHVFGHIAVGQQDVAFFATVQVESVVGVLLDAEGVVIAELDHRANGSNGVDGMSAMESLTTLLMSAGEPLTAGASRRPSRMWMVRSVMVASCSS